MSRPNLRISRYLVLGLLLLLAVGVILYWMVIPLRGNDKALIEACRLQNKFLVQIFLNLGANVHATDTGGVTAFERACERDLDPDLVQLLLKNGGTLDDLNGVLMLNAGMPSPGIKKFIREGDHYYCPGSNARNVTQLLLLGADPNSAESDGDQLTALMLAAFSRNLETVRALLKAGADPNRKSKGWDRALNTLLWNLGSCTSGKPDAAENALQIAALLIESGALPQMNVPHYVPSSDKFRRLFSEKCKSLNEKILQDVKQSVEKGGGAREPDRFGWTLLMKAAALGNNEAVSMLLRSEADINAHNMADETAKEIAESWNQGAIVALLQAHGAQ
jgi:uncharacterized protein